MATGPLFDAYCDESHDHNGPQYMVFGGIVVPVALSRVTAAKIRSWRVLHHMHGEMKWTKVKNQRLGAYKSYVDLFFDLAKADYLHFKCAVFDKYRINYTRYCDGNRLEGRYKFFYHFLLHKFGCYATSDTHRLRVFFDDTTYKYPLADFKRIFNAGVCKKYGRRGEIVRAVEPLASKQSEVIQLSDVLMGAVGFHCNDGHLVDGVTVAKVKLAEYMAERVGLPTLKYETPRSAVRFNIWRFRLRK